MALSVANIQTELIQLVGRLMDLVGIYYGVPQAGNPLASRYTNAALRDGFTHMGYRLSDPNGLILQDADFAVFDTRALRRLMEWGSLYCLEQVDRDWWRSELCRTPGMVVKVVNGVAVDPLDVVKRKLNSWIVHLRSEVKTPYQSMNVPVSIGHIVRGSICDPTLPPSAANFVPPWALVPDGFWYYGCSGSDFWGWGDWGYYDWGWPAWNGGCIPC